MDLTLSMGISVVISVLCVVVLGTTELGGAIVGAQSITVLRDRLLIQLEYLNAISGVVSYAGSVHQSGSRERIEIMRPN
jgi:branched-subunit amino acid ABC-type transport system permease component